MELRKIESKIQNNKEVHQYLSNPSFRKDEDHQVFSYKGVKSYPYVIIATTNQQFNKLSNQEKGKVFNRVLKLIDKDGMGLVKCGFKKYCSISDIQLFILDKADKLKENYFTFNIAHQEITHSYEDENGISQTEIVSGKDTKANDSKLEMVEVSGTIDGEIIYITGSIQNNSHTSLSYVEIKVTYFDDHKNIIDTDHTMLTDPLLSHEQKSFTLITHMIPGQIYSSYKVEAIQYDVNH
jgi:hypothetical protein